MKGTWFSFGRVVTSVVDIGPPADWVKINVRETVSLLSLLCIIFFFVVVDNCFIDEAFC